MRHCPTVLIPLFLLSLASNGALSEDSMSRYADRETRKLEPIGVEELPPQALVDVYVACLSSSVAPPEAGLEARLNTRELHHACGAERKNLSLKLPQDAVNQIDTVFVARFNELAAGGEEAPSSKRVQ